MQYAVQTKESLMLYCPGAFVATEKHLHEMLYLKCAAHSLEIHHII